MQQAAKVLSKTGERNKNIITKRREIADAIIGRTYEVSLDLIRPNPDQPRKIFGQEALENTAGSINGDVEEPIRATIRNGSSGFYFLIIDGERRWRAAKIAGLKIISCLVRRQMSDNAVYLSSVKSNCDHEPFNPIEESGIVVDLERRFGWNQARIAKELSKSPGYISNVLKYLKLCVNLRDKLMKGEIDKAVALNVASFPLENQEELLRRFLEDTGGKKLNPRDIPMAIKKVAKKMEIIPRPTKKGKKYLTHPDLVVSNFTKKMSDLDVAVKEFAELSNEEILGQKNCHIIDLINRVAGCHRRLGVVLERINSLD